MTIATELLSFDTADTSIGVCMANIARGTRIGVPRAMITRHESRLVCAGVCSLDAIRIHVARDAGRIGPLSVVTRCAAFNVPPCEFRVNSAAGTNTNRRKSCLTVGFGLELALVDVAAGIVAGRTECLLIMTALAVQFLPFNCKAMDELEIKIMDFCQTRFLTAINGSKPR